MSKVRFGFGAFGLAAILIATGCGDKAPTAPSEISASVAGSTSAAITATTGAAPEVSGEASEATTGAKMRTMAISPVVTLQSDLTASPSSVTVAAGTAVKFVDNSGRFVTIHSYNCTEFSQIRLNPGTSKSTMVFWPARKTCDYFAWDTNWSSQIFVGRVTVQ